MIRFIDLIKWNKRQCPLKNLTEKTYLIVRNINNPYSFRLIVYFFFGNNPHKSLRRLEEANHSCLQFVKVGCHNVVSHFGIFFWNARGSISPRKQNDINYRYIACFCFGATSIIQRVWASLGNLDTRVCNSWSGTISYGWREHSPKRRKNAGFEISRPSFLGHLWKESDFGRVDYNFLYSGGIYEGKGLLPLAVNYTFSCFLGTFVGGGGCHFN